jgi:hypothetical protein
MVESAPPAIAETVAVQPSIVQKLKADGWPSAKPTREMPVQTSAALLCGVAIVAFVIGVMVGSSAHRVQQQDHTDNLDPAFQLGFAPAETK